MSLVAAKCTQCGANIDVDATLLKGSCPFCHTEFLVEQVVNNYIGSAAEDINNLIKAGEARLAFGEYDVALEKFAQACGLYPQDYRGWWGLIKVKTQNFTKTYLSNDQLDEISELYKKIGIVSSGSIDSSVKETFEPYIAKVKDVNSNVASHLKEQIDKLKAEKAVHQGQYESYIASIRNSIKEKEMTQKISCGVLVGVLGILMLVLLLISQPMLVIVCFFMLPAAPVLLYKMMNKKIEEIEDKLIKISKESFDYEMKYNVEIDRLEKELFNTNGER